MASKKHDPSVVATQGWRQVGSRAHPVFHERINGKLKRVSTERGFGMIDEGILALTDQMREYIKWYWSK
jgi:hypothetical protein